MSSSNDRIQAVQELLGPNLAPDVQWQSIEAFLNSDPQSRTEILRWLLIHHKGYVDVRVRAGAELLTSHQHETWELVEDLVKSEDPDDRDTALTLLTQNPTTSSYQLARPLLSDPWPYLRLEAVDYLRQIYPLEARHALRELEHHKEEWVRKAAREALERLN